MVEFEERHTIFDQPGKLRLGAFGTQGNTGSYPARRWPIDSRRSHARHQRGDGEHPAHQPQIRLLRQRSSSRSPRISACSPARAGTTARTKSCRSRISTAACRAAFRSRAAIGDARATPSASAARSTALSAAHRDFLAAGGLGLLIGDGRLNYRPEQILETYYAYRGEQERHVHRRLSTHRKSRL